jgi:hypothetical protein
MTGPGTAPPPPRPTGDGVAIGLRVLCVAVGFLSFGFLNWALLLRLAVVRRRRLLDWLVFGVAGCVLPVVFISMISDSDKITGPADATGVGGVIVLWFLGPVYYLVMDGHYRRLAQQAAAVPQHFYGAPTPPYPYTPPLPQQQPQPYGSRPYSYNPYSEAPTPPPTPTPTPTPLPPPPRLNQVRAELDELSHLLREQEGDAR